MAEKNYSNEQLKERNGSDEEKQTGVKPTSDGIAMKVEEPGSEPTTVSR
jgi:hypothetical protein